MSEIETQVKSIVTSNWFQNLRDQFCHAFEAIEQEYAAQNDTEAACFERKIWQREGGGGGEMSLMRGQVFEKVGVNISTVHGEFSPEFRGQIPGTEDSPNFFATGLSIVAHMASPLVPAAHFNTRYIETAKSWFGGGADLTPMYIDDTETEAFHNAFKEMCDRYNPNYYTKFKDHCDKYFFLAHRNEARGVGGIFYDYLNTNDFDNDFAFTQDVGKTFLHTYCELVRGKMYLPWTEEQRDHQLRKRGRYVEFNLLYDRGTKFGLMTGGNVEAILMSMPPVVKW
ncbi:MAG: coproporphyrinogen oxidase [Rickettsiaceae bacterium]|jgi:coproporphyrinogen III oxidase|nr:coproporphyrinogen oxidase [Rickettsiaceae bacterium]